MAKILNPPAIIPVPEFNWKDIPAYEQACDTFRNSLRRLLKSRSQSKYAGEIIRFPVADSHAEYMVANLRPLELVHIPLWDAWHYDQAQSLRTIDVLNNIERMHYLARIKP